MNAEAGRCPICGDHFTEYVHGVVEGDPCPNRCRDLDGSIAILDEPDEPEPNIEVDERTGRVYIAKPWPHSW